MTKKTIMTAIAAIAGLTLQATAQMVTPAPQQVSSTAPQSDPLARAAALYATYQGDVTDVQAKGFTSAQDIDATLTNLGGHNPEQLTQGWMAYSALVAAQNPEFRAAVLDIEGYYGRDMLMTGMQNDVRYARTLSGGNDAVNQALTAVDADSRRLIGAAAYVKEQAYSLQAAGWAKGRVGNSGAISPSVFEPFSHTFNAFNGLATVSLTAVASKPECTIQLSHFGLRPVPYLSHSVSSIKALNVGA